MASVVVPDIDREAIDREAIDREAIDEILDTNWLDEFKAAERDYNEFYKEPVTSIRIYLIYVNKHNEIVNIHDDKCLLNAKGVLNRESIISLIKQNQMLFSVHYKLISLLKYNIDLEPTDINDFLKEDFNLSNKRFIHSEKYLENIQFQDSIRMFQDLNALFFIFNEDKPTMHNTKRVKLSATSSRERTKRNNHNIKNLKIKKQLR